MTSHGQFPPFFFFVLFYLHISRGAAAGPCEWTYTHRSKTPTDFVHLRVFYEVRAFFFCMSLLASTVLSSRSFTVWQIVKMNKRTKCPETLKRKKEKKKKKNIMFKGWKLKTTIRHWQEQDTVSTKNYGRVQGKFMRLRCHKNFFLKTPHQDGCRQQRFLPRCIH